MGTVRSRGEIVRTFIVGHVAKHSTDIVRITAEKFGISRQAAHKHVRRLIDERILVEQGATKSRRYSLGAFAAWSHQYKLAGLEEDRVWTEDVASRLGDLPNNVRAIWQYGFSEMLNNAIDHSAGDSVVVRVAKTAKGCEIIIYDDGVGIFRKLKDAFRLDDEQHAVLELAKGKLTTDPKRHSGEGIFFTSRLFDSYTILSGDVFFNHRLGREYDWITDTTTRNGGTAVFMELHNHTSRTLKKLFDQFSSDDEQYRFNKTVVPVELAKYGDDQLVSRSQAKRLLARIDRFERVIFDFANVSEIGQAFADEIFRVFARAHPHIELVAIHANSAVKRMIERARTHES